MKALKLIRSPYTGLVINVAYAVGNCLVGFRNVSWWFITVGAYYTNIAKSKITKANEKLAKSVTGGYKKIEQGVVDGYTKIEDKFVDTYLTKEGESVEEAKARLKHKN